MPLHNMKDVSAGDDQAEKWVTDQHNDEGSPETYTFLVDELDYTTASLASDGSATSNPNHEKYENNKVCMWVRDISGNCNNQAWEAHSYKEAGDCSISGAGQGADAQNGGAWWQEGFYASGDSPWIEVKIQAKCPSGTPINSDPTEWSQGTVGGGYLIKDNLDYYTHQNGLDLVTDCSYSSTIIQLHSVQPGDGDFPCD